MDSDCAMGFSPNVRTEIKFGIRHKDHGCFPLKPVPAKEFYLISIFNSIDEIRVTKEDPEKA